MRNKQAVVSFLTFPLFFVTSSFSARCPSSAAVCPTSRGPSVLASLTDPGSVPHRSSDWRRGWWSVILKEAAASGCTALETRCAECLSSALMYSCFLSTSKHFWLFKLQKKGKLSPECVNQEGVQPWFLKFYFVSLLQHTGCTDCFTSSCSAACSSAFHSNQMSRETC